MAFSASRKEFGEKCLVARSYCEDVILMKARGKLPSPHRPSSKLVSISTLGEEHIVATQSVASESIG